MNLSCQKRFIGQLVLGLLLFFAVLRPVRADVFSFTNIFNGQGLVIPDGEPEGVATAINVLGSNDLIAHIRLTLEVYDPLNNGFNGDLYVTLSHGSGFSVLLNRVGRSTENLFGYSDSGLSLVTFDDFAPAGDVHTYRQTLFGSDSVALSGSLTGTWQPDGRTTDPGSVLTLDARPAKLASFNGENMNGEWTLFMADMSPGGQSQLKSVKLEVTTVPEPATLFLGMIGAAVLCFGAMRSKRKRMP